MTAAKKQQTKAAEPQPAASTAQAPQAPKPMATSASQPQPTATKQSQTVAKLKAARTEKGIKLDQLSERQDGKFTLLQPTPEWPIVRIGPTGGLELPQIRSYAKAWDAAVDGLVVWQKQQARDQKKAATATPPVALAAKPEPKKPETPTAKKQKANAAIEAQLEARA